MNNFYLKMTIEIAIVFATLLIIGQYKGAECANDVLVYMNSFNMEAFDEFNLMCYVSMYAFLLGLLNVENNSNKNEEYIQKALRDIVHINNKLHRLNGWTKFLSGWSDDIIQEIYNEIKYSVEHYDEYNTIQFVRAKVNSIYDGSSFNYISLTTPKIIQFFQLIHSELDKGVLINMTFPICKNVLFTLLEPTQHIENNIIQAFLKNVNQTKLPMSIIYGCLLLLMTNEGIYNFLKIKDEFNQTMILLSTVIDVIIDIYRGMINILKTINTSYINLQDFKKEFCSESVDIKLLRMMFPAFYNVVQLSSQLQDMKHINGVEEKLLEINSREWTWIVEYNYHKFTNKFNIAWPNKFSKDENKRKGQEISTLDDGPLIRNNKINPSIIAYYTVYDSLWENFHHLSNADDRVVFLMELNAWTIILKHQLVQMKNSLLYAGYRDGIDVYHNFSNDIEFVKFYENYI